MREFKIVEMKDGHGDSKFHVKAKYGWGWFSYWEKWALFKLNTIYNNV